MLSSAQGTAATILLCTLGLSVLLTWLTRRLALRRNWVAQPVPDRWHRQPTPTMGGIAIFLSFLAGSAGFGLLADREVLLLTLTATGMFALGLVDDRRGLAPGWKFLGQLLLAGTLVLFGFHLTLTGSGTLDVFLTLLWLVGIANAFNLLDNMNGLCAGTAVLVAGFRGLLFLLEGQPTHALLCLVFLASTLGFLFFNYPAGRIFMGDAGSLFVGFWLAGLTLLGVYPYTRSYVGFLFFPVLVMGVPIFDTTLVTLTRILTGQAITQGGKDHASHRLVGYGFSEKKAVLLLWSLSLVTGFLALLTTAYGLGRVIPLIVIFAMALAVFGTYLARLKVSSTARLHAPAAHPVFGRMGVLFILLFDVALAAVSYYSAYLIRFEAEFGAGVRQVFLRSAGELILIKMSALAIAGVYRRWWRYFGLEDALRVVRAAAIASAGAMVYFFFAYRLEGLPRSVFFLDFLLFCFLALAFRFSFRILDRWAPLLDGRGKRVFIYQADVAGELALRLILQQRQLKPVGFLSEDGHPPHYNIHAVPVCGSVAEFERLAQKHRVDGVVVASRADSDAAQRLQETCRRLGFALYQAVLEVREDTDATMVEAAQAIQPAPQEKRKQPAVARAAAGGAG